MSFLKDDFKFIDLFAGIGGFHFAMKKLSAKSKCVYASEIDKNAIEVYNQNFNQSSESDITKVDPNNIPDFDVLCAGFPCQPFSKAGNQNGFSDTRGTLFFDIMRIIKCKIEKGSKPKLLILENVRNLASHDDYKTWNIIKSELKNLGYNLMDKPLILSPADFGVPQLRDRSIILCIDESIYSKTIEFRPNTHKTSKNNIFDILENEDRINKSEYEISEYQRRVFDIWDEFMAIIGVQKIGFPIWSDEFFKEYPLDDLPKWKQIFIIKNRSLYKKHKKKIDKWYKKNRVHELVKTHRKFEWQAGDSITSIYEGLIQFRPSGVRVKKPDYAPTLVAMAHIPIIGKYKRFITPVEAARLQSLPDNFKFDNIGNDIYRLLGNAVNVEVIYNTTSQFIEYINTKKESMKNNCF